MGDERATAAVDRIGRALGRLEAAAEWPHGEAPGPNFALAHARGERDSLKLQLDRLGEEHEALAAKHRALRAKVEAAVARLDGLIGRSEGR